MTKTLTFKNLPFATEEWPHMNGFSSVTEVKPSNKIEIHKAKKYSKYNFILISDCLADIHGT